MKKNLKRIFALVLCLTVCLTVFAGCGGGSEETKPVATKATTAPTEATKAPAETTKATTAPTEETESEEDVEIFSIDACYDNDLLEVSLMFLEDYTCIYSDSIQQAEADYFFDLDLNLYLDFGDGESYIGHADEDGDIFIDNVEGYFTEVDSVSYYPDADIDNTGSKEYEEIDDTTTRYYDYEGNIALSYSSDMTNFEDELEDGTVLLADGVGGYFLCVNMTEEYWNYSESDESFLMQVMDVIVPSIFEEIYGDGWNCSDVNFVDTEDDRSLGIAEMNIYNEDYDLYSMVELYEVGGEEDTILINVYFSDYGDEVQFQNLYLNIGGFDEAN